MVFRHLVGRLLRICRPFPSVKADRPNHIIQQKLDAPKKQVETSAPKEALDIMHRATQDLAQSGIMERIVKKGCQAPDFTLKELHPEVRLEKPF